jgi:alkyl sulfatase BDS1-like metallo-beta-lactamase superfamily hydrolase
MLSQTPVERFLEAMAAGLDGPAAEGKALKVNLVFSDTKESFVLWIENAVHPFQTATISECQYRWLRVPTTN